LLKLLLNLRKNFTYIIKCDIILSEIDINKKI
jgi:hypothetical protein